MMAISRIAAKHGSFNRTYQVAPAPYVCVNPYMISGPYTRVSIPIDKAGFAKFTSVTNTQNTQTDHSIACTIETRNIFTSRRYAKRGICRRRVSVRVCVCECVCVSVTLRYCIKTAKLTITQITPHDSPVTLVF